ncbi:MAG: hypothetical protein KAQ66_03200 [Rhodospirillaceae bacterium]|nr:hypothetical protein [Rhodospirillaceae bacterium]
MYLKKIMTLALGALAFVGANSVALEAKADTHPMKPFILASNGSGDMAATVADVTAKLEGAGFSIAGTYTPYPTATIIVVTSGAQRSSAARSDMGGFGAVQRVAVTQMGGKIQVSYTNPPYMAAAYRMDSDLASTTKKLEAALGGGKEFGLDKGKTAAQMNKFHYMIMMPYFDEANLLGCAASHNDMVKRIEGNLAKGMNGLTQVYKISIPGKKEVVFGVASKGDDKLQNDEFIMSEIDFKDVRSSAHLPHEILVSGDKAYALSLRFRIAMNFPDLSMMGSNSFMNIMGSPPAFQKAVTNVSGGVFKGQDNKAECPS